MEEGTPRERLLLAAAAVFGEYGFKAATIREICRRADVGIASVNYYFRDKEGLYLEVYRDLFTRALALYPPTMGLSKKPSAEERLHAFIRSFFYRLTLIGGRHSLLVREMLDPSPALVKLHTELANPLQGLLIEIVGDLLGDGCTTQDTFTCATSIIGQCLFYGPHTQSFRTVLMLEPHEEELDKIAGCITRFSLGGIQAMREGSPTGNFIPEKGSDTDSLGDGHEG